MELVAHALQLVRQLGKLVIQAAMAAAAGNLQENRSQAASFLSGLLLACHMPRQSRMAVRFPRSLQLAGLIRAR